MAFNKGWDSGCSRPFLNPGEGWVLGRLLHPFAKIFVDSFLAHFAPCFSFHFCGCRLCRTCHDVELQLSGDGLQSWMKGTHKGNAYLTTQRVSSVTLSRLWFSIFENVLVSALSRINPPFSIRSDKQNSCFNASATPQSWAWPGWMNCWTTASVIDHVYQLVFWCMRVADENLTCPQRKLRYMKGVKCLGAESSLALKALGVCLRFANIDSLGCSLFLDTSSWPVAHVITSKYYELILSYLSLVFFFHSSS